MQVTIENSPVVLFLTAHEEANFVNNLLKRCRKASEICSRFQPFLIFVFAERKTLEKLDPIIYKSAVATSSFVIPMAKGPANTKYVFM